MATYSVLTAATTGTTVTPTAVTASDDFPNDGKTFLYITNGGGSSINVTIDSTTNCDQGFDHDLVVAVANGATKIIGPFSTTRFGASVGVAYSGTTSVTASALRHST